MTKFLSPDPLLSYEDAGHEYFYAGCKVDCFSDVAAGLGLKSYAGIPEAVLARAALRGTAVHKACELHDKGTLDDSSVSGIVRPYLSGWKAFVADTGAVPVAIEFKAYSKIWGYAGTVDRVLMIQGKLYVIDIKTGGMKELDKIQTAAYKILIEELGCRIDGRMVVQLFNDGKYKPLPHINVKDELEWKSVMTTWNLRKRLLQ